MRVELPKTNLLMIANEVGYIMCAALDVDVLNEKLADREVIAGRAEGVRTIDDLLHAPLQKITHAAAQQYGWEEDRKSTRLNSSHVSISYAVFCLKKKNISHVIT